MACKDLLEETYKLLSECDESIPELAENAGVNKHWLAKLSQKAIKNPGINGIQKLYEYLSNCDKVAA